MDPLIIAALVMLVAWAGITFSTAAPGVVHLLLTGGVFLLIWRIAIRGTRGTAAAKPTVDSQGTSAPKR